MLLNNVMAAKPLDTESLSRERLDLDNRTRTNPFPWTGQFSPELVELLLANYAPDGGVVLDPFVGSGTSLLEASRTGLGARGADLNPAAVILSRVYELANFSKRERRSAIDRLAERLVQIGLEPFGPLFADRAGAPLERAEIEAALVEIWRGFELGPAKILAAALVVLCDFHQKNLDPGTVSKAWARLVRTVRELPRASSPVSVHHADARELPLESSSIDLVLTSPPYINVFNYHQKFRRSVEALEWDVLRVARSEIGSNRQNRGNRFLTVIQYSLDMALALGEARRVVKSNGRLIFVLGRESKVRGTAFFNGELVAELAVRAVGLELENRQERRFKNRFGVDIYEDVLHFVPTGASPTIESSLESAREIAGRALVSARPHVPEKERYGLEDALDRLHEVDPSPVLEEAPKLRAG